MGHAAVGSPQSIVLGTAARLDVNRPLAPQLAAATPVDHRRVAAAITSRPGRSARLLRRAVYRLLVGVVPFAGEVYPMVLPRGQLAAIEPTIEKGTNLQHALKIAGRHLRRHPGAEPVVLVVTDGEPTAHLDEDGEGTFWWPPLPETVPTIDAGIPSALLERRPDIASAERQMASANAQVGIAVYKLGYWRGGGGLSYIMVHDRGNDKA